MIDPDFVELCSDPHEELPEWARDWIQRAIGDPFEGRTLATIVAELQLLHSALIPDGDGIFRINLLGELWSGTEEEAFALVANRLFRQRSQFDTPQEGIPEGFSYEILGQEVSFLAQVADIDAPGWLETALTRPDRDGHPFLAALAEVRAMVAARDDAGIRSSHRVIWLRRLAQDWMALSGTLPPDRRLASRLRDSDACESLKYEIFVMAAYARQGGSITVIDDMPSRSGECTVSWAGSRPVHIECKRKTAKIIRRRDAQTTFERLKDAIFDLLRSRRASASITVWARYDPTTDDIPNVVAIVDRLLSNSAGDGRATAGKLSVELGPSPVREVAPGHTVLVGPRGFDYAVTEGKTNGTQIVGEAMSFAWSTHQRWRWIRSAVDEFKRAAAKIPSAEPGIIYIQVPDNDLPIVLLRARVLAGEIRSLLQHEHGRISAVVVTGEAAWMKAYTQTEQRTAVTTCFYEVIINARARNPLPPTFEVFGRDFTAK